jgi:hypothetical protein
LSFVLAIGIIGDLWLATTRTNNNNSWWMYPVCNSLWHALSILLWYRLPTASLWRRRKHSFSALPITGVTVTGIAYQRPLFTERLLSCGWWMVACVAQGVYVTILECGRKRPRSNLIYQSGLLLWGLRNAMKCRGQYSRLPGQDKKPGPSVHTRQQRSPRCFWSCYSIKKGVGFWRDQWTNEAWTIKKWPNSITDKWP